MPNYDITVSNAHIPKTHLPKAVGVARKFFYGHSSRMSDIKLNFVLNSSAYMPKISSAGKLTFYL